MIKVAKCTKTEVPKPVYFDERHDFVFQQESEKEEKQRLEKEKEREKQRLYRLRKKVAELDFCIKTEVPEPVYFDERHDFIFQQKQI